MSMRGIGRGTGPGVAAMLFVMACGSTDGESSAPGGADASHTTNARAILDGQIVSGNGNDCTGTPVLVGDFFALGSFGDTGAQPPLPASSVVDGSPIANGAVSVTCRVHESSTGQFDVNVAAIGGGAFQLDGALTNTGDQAGIHVVGSRSETRGAADFEASDCTVQYLTAVQGVAMGRIWGRVTCASAKNGAGKTCSLVADFRFESCEQ